MANGTWNHPIPKCKPKEDDQISPCDLPGIANGKYQDTYGGDGYDYGDYPYGDSNTDTTGITTLDREADVEVVCTDGFQLVGPSIVKCYLNRTLSEIPTCAKISCRVQALQNGAIAVGKIAAHSQVDFNVTLTASCDAGYTLIGTDRLVCEEKGEFDEKFPKCITNTTAFCTIPTIPNGRPASLRPGLNAATDDTVTVLCQKGYLVDTSTNVSRCGQNGAWLPKYPQCIIAKCNAEQRITDGSIHLDGNQAPRFVEYDVNVTVVCDKGFRLVDGPKTLQCGEDGTFTSKFPRCVQENTDSCRVNEMMDNHTIINTNLTVIPSGQRVQISCVDGFVSTLRDKFFNCDEGVWRQRQSMPVCIADPKCTLPEIKNGAVEAAIFRRGRENSILENDIAHVRCTGGYILQGNPTLKCVEVEKFKDPLPTCVPVSIQCTVPAVSHGEVVNESYEVIQAESRVTANTKVFVRCQGSEVISSENNGSRCLPNGNWDPELPATCFRAEAFSVSNDQVTEGNGTANQNVYIGIGVCVVLAIIVAVVAFFLHRRRNRKKSDMERIVENCHDNMTYMSAVEAGGAVTVRYVRKSPNGSADNGVTEDDGYLVMKDQPCEHEVPGTSHLRQTHVRDSVPADFGDDDTKRESVVTFKPAYRESSTQETNSTHSTEGKM